MPAPRWLPLCFLWVACSTPLPSEAPLGVGPLVAAEQQSRQRAGDPADAGADAPEPRVAELPPPTPPAPPEVGSAPTAGTSAMDAGAAPAAADAGPPGKPGPVATVKWAGLYTGKDTSRFAFAGAPEQVEDDPNAKTRVADRADGGVDLIPISSSDGKDICTVKATAKDPARKEFDIAPAQRCFEPDSGGMSGIVRSGTARFDGKKLVIDLVLDLEVTAGDTPLKGTLKYHFEGARP